MDYILEYRGSFNTCLLNKNNFQDSMSKTKNIPDYSTRFSISLHRFLSFENCDISKDNIISGKAAKVL
jgi:hypothetical protein